MKEHKLLTLDRIIKYQIRSACPQGKISPAVCHLPDHQSLSEARDSAQDSSHHLDSFRIKNLDIALIILRNHWQLVKICKMI